MATTAPSTIQSRPTITFYPKSLQFSKSTSLPFFVASSRKTLTNLKLSASDLTAPTSADSSISLKSRLRSGDRLYGLFLLSFSPTVAEIAAFAGYDFVVIDMEHGPGGIPEALECLRALSGSKTPAILRLPDNCPVWAKKALDLGPQGLMFPMIESAKSARKAVSYCRFPPGGVRGSAHTVVRGSRYGMEEGYLSNYEEELLIMCQVESAEGVKKVEEIAGVDGVDCVQMGPLDLSASMGYLWDPGHKKVREMMRVAEKGILASDPLKKGAYLAGFAMPHDPADNLKRRGYHMVSGAVDVALFKNAAVEDVRKFKQGNDIDDDDDHDNHRHNKGAKEGDDDKYWSE